MQNNIYALLIGIDCYLPNQLSDGSSYKSLRGCVRDINHVEAYFVNILKVPNTNILKLTASNVRNSIAPKESPEQLPTYKNMVAKFTQITDIAQKGDVVYIHYSGHGGRAITHFPKLKGNLGKDETLVPTDIGTSDANYLRDVELAYIFKRMVDKGLLLTVVLDSCHSGGAARGVDSDIRGLSVIDTTPRPTESLVASPEELIAAWDLNNNTTRNVTVSGWLPEPNGYTLLAACRDNELAQEYPFDGKERNGALTYWLLDSLKKLGTQVSYKTLHERLLAKIHSQFEQQTPMLQGDKNRLIFGSQSVTHQLTIPVLKVDIAKNKVLLQIGEAYGIRNGVEFAVYSLGTQDFNQTNKRVALVKLIELGAVESWAEIKEFLFAHQIADIELGASALLLHESVKIVRKVALLPNKAALAQLERMKRILEGNNLIEFVSGDEISTGDKDIAYQVCVNDKGEYEILKAGQPITNLRPILTANSNNAITLIKRLIHLCKYQAIIQLDNNDPVSTLAGKIQIELCKAGENRQLVPFDEPGNIATLNVDEYVYLKVRNSSSQTLNITVLAAQPDWRVAKIYPTGADFAILEPGQELEKPIRIITSLPEGYTQGTEVFKVFATVGATNFDWLKLPPLDRPNENMRSSHPSNPLEQLFVAIGSENPPRNVSVVAYASDEWTTEQVELNVKRM